jgi:DNA-binding transcriptional regulator YhcF (GntR family)
MDQFQSTQPIYLQIMALIKRQIATSKLLSGAQLGSVRDLAMTYQVNPNTVQRALSELEREGLVKSDRTIGRFVTDDDAAISELHRGLFDEATTVYVDQVNELNISVEEVVNAVQQKMSKGETT